MSVKKSVLEKFDSKKLETYLLPDNRYVSDAVKFAYQILKSRGRVFSEEEENLIQILISNKETEENKSIENITYWDKNATDDSSSIELYSQYVIYIFSILFSVAFGAVLLAINLKKLNLKRTMYLTLILGFGYTILQIFVAEHVVNFLSTSIKMRNTSSTTFLLSAIGAMGLHYIWKQNISQELKYRKKSFIIPLIIALIILIPIIYITISSM